MIRKISGFLNFCFWILVAEGCVVYSQMNFSAKSDGRTDDSELKTMVFGPLSGDWRLVSVETSDRGKIVPVFSDRIPTLEFYLDGRFKGHTGCNEFVGVLKIENDKLRFGDILSSSKQCEEPVCELEEIIFRELKRTDDYSVQQNVLYLTRDSDVLMIYERPQRVSCQNFAGSQERR